MNPGTRTLFVEDDRSITGFVEPAVIMTHHPRRVLSRDVLLWRVWHQDSGIATNVVDVYVGYLREKVDAPGELKPIRPRAGRATPRRG